MLMSLIISLIENHNGDHKKKQKILNIVNIFQLSRFGFFLKYVCCSGSHLLGKILKPFNNRKIGMEWTLSIFVILKKKTQRKEKEV